MKNQLQNTILMAAFAFIGLSNSASAQDANLTISNFNSFYDSYNTGTKVISGIQVEVGADGDNSDNFISSDFETSLYLLPCNSSGTPIGSTPIIVSVFVLPGGTLNHFGTYTWTGQSVDLSQVSGLADGMYRMGAWINSDPDGNGIGNPPDDQNDNAGLIQSSAGTSSGSVINFTAGSTNSIESEQILATTFNLFPNPASTLATIACEFTVQPKNARVRIYDMTGAMMKEVVIDNQKEVQFSVSEINAGIYFYSLVADNQLIAVNKLVIIH